MNIDRLSDANDKLTQNGQNNANGRQKRTFFETLKPSQLIRSSQYYNNTGNGGTGGGGGGGNTGGGSGGGGGGNRRSSSNHQNNNNNNNARQNQNNQFLDEVHVRSGNFLMHHQSHLINQQMAAQNHNAQRGMSRSGGVPGQNMTINLNRMHVSSTSRDASRCAVCTII